MTARSSTERADELTVAWDRMREHVGHEPQTCEWLLAECAHELTADPRGPLAYSWPPGPVLALLYLATRKSEDDEVGAASDAAQAADRALRDAPCTHQGRAFEGDSEGEFGNMDVLRQLADDGRPWTGLEPRDACLCPRGIAGRTLVVREVLCPGSADGVPPFLLFEDRYVLEGLIAIMEGCPFARAFEVAWNLSFAASALQEAVGDELGRPGLRGRHRRVVRRG